MFDVFCPNEVHPFGGVWIGRTEGYFQSGTTSSTTGETAMAIHTRARASHPVGARPVADGNGESRSRVVVGDQPAGGFRRVLRGSVALCAVLVAGGVGLAAVVRRRGSGTAGTVP